MIFTSNLRFSYKEGGTYVFPDIKLDAEEHLLIHGQSGVGKTTLMRLLGGLMRPESGRISIDGYSLTSMSNDQLNQFRGEKIGLIFQKYHHISALTVNENLSLRQRISGFSTHKERRISLIKKLGLNDIKNKRVTQLSQGQKQRLTIGLGLIHKPKLILADEPTSNLDNENCEKVISILKEESSACASNLIIITQVYRIIVIRT